MVIGTAELGAPQGAMGKWARAKAQAQHIMRYVLTGFDCHFSPESGDKETRALPLAAQAEAGNVFLLEGPWNDTFLDEIAVFPMGKWKDQVDAASCAFTELTTAPKPTETKTTTMVRMY